MSDFNAIQEQYEAFRAQKLKLDMTRGQPADSNFDLSNEMLTIVTDADLVTPSGVAIRNYPGGVAGIAEARALFATILGVEAQEMIVGNNSSLELMSHILMWAMLKGVKGSARGWVQDNPKLIVTVPGYDRHFSLAAGIGYQLVTVPMTETGPDMEEVEALAASDPSIKGIFFVPTYSNPTGDTISADTARRLVSMPTAAPDFTIFADDAYAVHHLVENPQPAPNLLAVAKEVGNPDRVILFGSTSKITFASAGIGFIGMSKGNIAHWSNLFGLQTIGPNKVEQYRHVKFLQSYPDGIGGLMRAHAAILAPKFAVVQTVLGEQLGGSGLATWADPKGGYFVSLDTTYPVADRVVELAKGVGVALTPAGATHPHGIDPNNRNIRLSPSRPPLAEVELAMRVVAVCVQLASAEYLAQ